MRHAVVFRSSALLLALALAVVVLALGLFVASERHREKVRRSALLDLGLFTFSTFSGATSPRP